MTKETIEGMLTRIALEFDRDYLNEIGLVIGVKFTRFFSDWREMQYGLCGVTFGMYDGNTRVIYLNAYFHKMLEHGFFLSEVKGVIFHELCHGALLNSLQPIRLGMYQSGPAGDHGPDFEALEHRYSDYIRKDRLQAMMPDILGWMRHNVPAKLREESGR